MDTVTSLRRTENNAVVMKNKDKTIVVTRHASYTRYLLDQGIIAEEKYTVIEHANPEDIRNKHIITSGIPLHLAELCNMVSVVPLNLPVELRGKELTVEEVAEHAGNIQTYMINKV